MLVADVFGFGRFELSIGLKTCPTSRNGMEHEQRAVSQLSHTP